MQDQFVNVTMRIRINRQEDSVSNDDVEDAIVEALGPTLISGNGYDLEVFGVQAKIDS